MFSRNGATDGIHMLVFLPFFVCVRSHCDVHDNSAATSFAHAPLQHVGNSNAHAQCTEISIPKRDGHTYIHTDAKQDAKQD